MDYTSLQAQISNTPFFEPTYINLGYIFNLIFKGIFDTLRYLIDLILGLEERDIALIKGILLLISLTFFITILVLVLKHRRLRSHEAYLYQETIAATNEKVVQKERNRRWAQVLEHLDELSESDWRLGILEADNILAEMLDAMGYHGESIGEMLKGVEVSDFLTLQDAWEAHKVRNKIAHEGASFALSKREADRVIGLYQKVFKEFKYI